MQKVTSDRTLEIACFDPDSCMAAARAGAQRIEFCSGYESGGVTPAYDDIAAVRKRLEIPLHVIVRPRAGNFLYSAAEKEQMLRDIRYCRAQGVDGVVLGALTSEATIDESTCRQMIVAAGKMSLTFHRAVDACTDIRRAVEQLAELGFDRVLSSGGCATAMAGASVLYALQAAYGQRIIVMPGGGIRSQFLGQLIAQTGCTEYHSAARTPHHPVLDEAEIKSLLACLNP